jgi:hypothetical protein
MGNPALFVCPEKLRFGFLLTNNIFKTHGRPKLEKRAG